MPESRSRASRTSVSVGAVRSVAKVEHLLHYLPHRRERIQLAALHFVQQAPKLRVVCDRLLQMRLCAPRRNRKHLAGEVLAPALVELPFLLEVGAVRLDLL